MTADYVVSQLTAFGSLEFLAAGCLENRAALLYDIRYILSPEIDYLIGDKSAIASIYTLDFKPAEYSRTGDGTNCGVHAGGVASGSKYADTLDFCHCFFDTCFGRQN